jgi:hypothetical protein
MYTLDEIIDKYNDDRLLGIETNSFDEFVKAHFVLVFDDTFTLIGYDL